MKFFLHTRTLILMLVMVLSFSGMAPTQVSGGDDKVHVVQQGETLWSISKKYGVGIEQLKAWNSLQTDALSVGQRLVIKSAGQGEPIKPATNPTPEANPKSHTVKSGESLYSISKQYGVTIAQLRQWNRLPDTNIQPGQKLSLQPQAGVTYLLASEEEAGRPAHPQTPLVDLIEAHDEAEATDSLPAEEVEEEVPVGSDPELVLLAASGQVRLSAAAQTEAYTDALNGKAYLRVREKGNAAAIQTSGPDAARFYGLHAHLPKGSYVRVHNPANGQSILVEIAGPLPEGDKAIIRLTARSRHYLRLGDQGEVELRYMIEQ